jgi:CheY-like chemotaxis protein
MKSERPLKMLERRLEECIQQLEIADQTRTQLLTASHDLRQPMHALALFVAQLRGLVFEVEQARIVEQIAASVAALSARFNELINLFELDFVASGPERTDKITDSAIPTAPLNRANGKLVVLIDDDPLVLDATCGLLRSWGCSVVIGMSSGSAIASLANQQRPPDLIISDFRLSDSETGIEAIAELRRAFNKSTPAFLISGDTSLGALHEAQAAGFHLLYKPVDPMTLRALFNRILKANG